MTPPGYHALMIAGLTAEEVLHEALVRSPA